MNYVVLVGRVSNIEDIVSLNSKKYTYITLAVQRTNKNEFGIYDTDFIMCETTGNIAEKIKEFVKKGDLISVKGRIENEDFISNTRNKVIVDKVVFLSNKSSSLENEE